jgi:SRSO17 transposase
VVESFTPASWFPREKTDPVFRTKPAIALELVDQALAADRLFRAVAADRLYSEHHAASPWD